MNLGLLILISLFPILLCMNVPIAIILAMVTVAAMSTLGYEQILITVASDMASGIDSFTLLAIPFFILSGDLMGAGGLARRLIDFANSLVGRFTGGLGLVNTLTCVFFGAISGSAAAAVSSIGGTLIPEMNRKGYDRDFNIALTTCSATTGLLIPPSNVMIVYAVTATNISIASLFLAGILPGLLMGLFIMLVCIIISAKKGYGGSVNAGVDAVKISILSSGIKALPSLLLVVVVLWGILGGIFTPTEASGVAVVWAFVLGVLVYKEIKWADLPALIRKSAKTTAVVLLLVACSSAMSRFLTNEQVPAAVSGFLMGLSENPLMILLTINFLLLIVGVFMDMTPAVLIFTPILLPVALELGLDPLHFGIILIMNLCIGLCTPPVGTCLFIGCSVGKGDIARVSKAMLPFYAAMILALLLITYIPEISMFIPSLLNN
jgi:tripartite ATP-independent transporter DctM subunit